jgi:hypothetical protein
MLTSVLALAIQHRAVEWHVSYCPSLNVFLGGELVQQRTDIGRKVLQFKVCLVGYLRSPRLLT